MLNAVDDGAHLGRGETNTTHAAAALSFVNNPQNYNDGYLRTFLANKKKNCPRKKLKKRKPNKNLTKSQEKRTKFTDISAVPFLCPQAEFCATYLLCVCA